jgi:hypothetical protein
MLPRDPRDAAPLSELPNEFWKFADAVALCDKRSSHCGVFSPKSFPWRVAAAALLRAELWTAQLQSPALKSARHVCLREYGAFLHAQILRLGSMQICPAACHAGHVRESVFLAYFYFDLINRSFTDFKTAARIQWGVTRRCTGTIGAPPFVGAVMGLIA